MIELVTRPGRRQECRAGVLGGGADFGPGQDRKRLDQSSHVRLRLSFRCRQEHWKDSHTGMMPRLYLYAIDITVTSRSKHNPIAFRPPPKMTFLFFVG